MDGDDERDIPNVIYVATRSEYCPPSVIPGGLWRPTLEPFEILEKDLPIRDWLLNTAGMPPG